MLYAGAHGMSNDLDVVLDAAKILQDMTISSTDLALKYDKFNCVSGRWQGKACLATARIRVGIDQCYFPAIRSKA